jgi:hypothetical protein
LAINAEDLKFEAGGTRVDDKDYIHGVHAAATAAFRRRASA